jgi:guanine deaminase
VNERVIVASGFHAPERGQIVAFRDAVITIDADGTIRSVTEGTPAPEGAERLPEGWVLLPGFVDLHVHAPQYPQLGTALDVPLEDWLQVHTFPLEARYADADFAEEVWRALVADLLAVGTTTAVYFATIHVEATVRLAQVCMELGQRAFVGKVAMDHPDACPAYYRDGSADEGVAGTRAVIDRIAALAGDGGLVQPIITPRFIPTCTDELLAGLGQLAAETGVRVQSHVSESDWEHGHVLDRCGRSDAAALDSFGLMRAHGIFAHGTHLSGTDMDLMRDRGAAVAHCPLSNAYFAGAVFPLRAALERELHVGLGSDISGGPAGTIWETARMAVAASRLRESGVDAELASEARGTGAARVDFRTAFWLATAGGGEAVGLPVGVIAPGMQFDAMAVDPGAAAGGIRLWPGDAGERVLEKLLYGANRANVARVWVAGQRVCG